MHPPIQVAQPRGIVPVPPLEEIAANRQFLPRTITRDEFEAVWIAATR
jgi:hypothetical protein